MTPSYSDLDRTCAHVEDDGQESLRGMQLFAYTCMGIAGAGLLIVMFVFG